MKSLKKFTYPFAFSIFSFVFYILLTSLLIEIPFPYGERRPDAWDETFGVLWYAFITPVFCTIYGRIVCREKYKYWYVIYNSVALLSFWVLLFEFRILGCVTFIVWTTVLTICASGPFKKPKDDNTEENESVNLISKKKIIIVISSFTVVALIVSSVFVFRHYYPTHYPYDDSFIIGSTEEEIIEKYGEFDRQIGSNKPNSVYSKSYLIHEASGDILFGSDYNTWYEIRFKNGIAQSVSLRTVDRAA